MSGDEWSKKGSSLHSCTGNKQQIVAKIQKNKNGQELELVFKTEPSGGMQKNYLSLASAILTNRSTGCIPRAGDVIHPVLQLVRGRW